LHPHSNQRYRIYSDQQQVVGQHSRAAPSPSCPCKNCTLRYKQRIQDQERWCGHCEHHGDCTTNAEKPCYNFQCASNRIRLPVVPDPVYNSNKQITHWPTTVGVTYLWPNFYLWLQLGYQIDLQNLEPNYSQQSSNRSHCEPVAFAF
jgi:hypothetical protein